MWNNLECGDSSPLSLCGGAAFHLHLSSEIETENPKAAPPPNQSGDQSPHSKGVLPCVGPVAKCCSEFPVASA